MEFVFSVESIGLLGNGFAVGWSVIDVKGQELEVGFQSIDPKYAFGLERDRRLAMENIVPLLPPPTVVGQGDDPNAYLVALRSRFIQRWVHWQRKGARLWAHRGWLSEAQFLKACAKDRESAGQKKMATQYNDILVVMQACWANPADYPGRIEVEEPRHHPVCDARYYARLLHQGLAEIKA